MRELAGSLAELIAIDCTEAGFDTVSVTVQPADPGWLIEGALVAGLQAGNLRLMAGADTIDYVAINVQDLGVEYSNLRGSGVFGSKQIDRIIRLQLNVILKPVRSGGNVVTKTYTKQVSDTVTTSAVESLENRGIPATLGRIPEGGFFSNLAEPLIVIGALAVGVYLLFTVRS